jgi:preprotein translocase subunit SecG
MYTLLILLYIIVSVALTIVILLQSSKGGGLAGAFGGSGAAGAVFGGRGAATFLSKTTTVLATAFLVLSLILALMSRTSTAARGLVEQERERQSTSATSGIPIVPENPATTQPSPPAAQPDSSVKN